VLRVGLSLGREGYGFVCELGTGQHIVLNYFEFFVRAGVGSQYVFIFIYTYLYLYRRSNLQVNVNMCVYI